MMARLGTLSHTERHILLALDYTERAPLEIRKEIVTLHLRPPTLAHLYLALERMEHRGLLSSRWDGPNRRVYRVTTLGLLAVRA